tara:strand:+ start:681 stop:1175 length:495 start_codon:yes stop_codon:yes gene_type:complete
MNRKYFLNSPQKVARLTRLVAKAIDLFIVLIVSIPFYPGGVLLGVIYISVCDALRGGQSVGKKFIGFSVISLDDGRPCSYKQSFIRNLPLSVPFIFSIFPFWGWIFSVLISPPLILLEVYLLFKLDSAHRLGDVMADTSVVSLTGAKISSKKQPSSWFETSRGV